MKILLITPPMTQLNTPYPATAYLSGLLRDRKYETTQADLALELALRLLTPEVLDEARIEMKKKRSKAPSVVHFLENFDAIRTVVSPTIAFLQGRDPSLSLRIASREWLPEGPSFRPIAEMSSLVDGEDPLGWAFGALGGQDRAKYLATLFLNDLAAAYRDGVDSRFQLSRFAESLAASQPTFDPLLSALENPAPTLVDRHLDALTAELIEREKPDVVGLTTPFPGNVYGAFRIARTAKRVNSKVKTLLGGGWVNTELRSLTEPRVFDFFDYVCLDDGERPLLTLLEHLDGKVKADKLFRTYVREKGVVKLVSDPMAHDIPHRDLPTPTYEGLKLDRYLSILEMLNPVHRIWSDGRWNKLTLAHGCYWKKCSFCDVSLDYIGRYDTIEADRLVDHMVKLHAETGQSGFHFVDEAAPPATLRALSERLIERRIPMTWWGNIRFEKTFTPELTSLMAKGGCVAVTGGLEVASDRLLKLMQKGVTVAQVARVTRAFMDSGILVHAYLMYGFPSQTVQETIDSLERVRQLFAAGCIQSAFWHRFAATIHSPIGLKPKDYGIRLQPTMHKGFARNDVQFIDPVDTDHDALGKGLEKSLYNYMHGVGLEEDVRVWFEGIEVPATTVPEDLVERALEDDDYEEPAAPIRRPVPARKKPKVPKPSPRGSTSKSPPRRR